MTEGLFSAPAYKVYGRIMADEAYDNVGFTTRLALKDMSLVLAAGDMARVPLPSASLLRDRLPAPSGAAVASGGFNCRLRDLARFGEMIRLQGKYNGQQIVPAAVIADIRQGGSPEAFVPAGYKTLPGWSYRKQWWISHDDHGAFMARGIHGQAIYIDPKAEMVIARFASHPLAGNMHFDPTSLPAYRAIADQLLRKPR